MTYNFFGHFFHLQTYLVYLFLHKLDRLHNMFLVMSFLVSAFICDCLDFLIHLVAHYVHSLERKSNLVSHSKQK
jgi:ABC-type arginine/histidine transport system permease subunit